MRRVSEIMIGKDVASGDGFLEIVDKDYVALAPGSTVTDTDVIYIAQHTGVAGVIRYSQPIVGKLVKSYLGTSYEAPAGKVVTIGVNAAQSSGSIEVNQGAEYTFLITIKGEIAAEQGVIKKRYHVMASDSATQLSIATDIITQINAMPDFSQYLSLVDIRVNGADYGVRITSLPGVEFEVSLDENFGATTLQTDTAVVMGNGSSAQVLAIEDFAKGYKGFLGDRRMFVGDFRTNPVYHTVSGETYDLYVIEHCRAIALEGGLDNPTNPLVTIIAVPDGAATFDQAAFEVVLNDYMASTPMAFAPVNL